MKTYHLEIITPENIFFSGEVVSVTVHTPDGQRCLMAGHIPIVLPLAMGPLVVRTDCERLYAVCTGGFLEMTGDKGTVLAQAAEWIEDVDVSRAEQALERAVSKLAVADNIFEKRRYQWALERAEARLDALKNIACLVPPKKEAAGAAPDKKDAGGTEG